MSTDTITISCTEFDKETGKEYLQSKKITYDEIDKLAIPEYTIFNMVRELMTSLKTFRENEKNTPKINLGL